MVQVFCKLCLKSVTAIDWNTHTTQKQHLQQLPCKLVVKGSFHKDKSNEVYEYFSKFGGIRGQEVTSDNDQTTITYRFWNPRTYSEIIHQEHTLFDQKLEVSWYIKPQNGPLEYVVQTEQMRNENITYRKLNLINSIKERPSFSDQLTILLNQFETIRSEMKSNRQIILEDLNTILTPNKIHFFGSSITGLEIYDSDVNMYLDGTTSLELVRDTITKSENYCDILLKSAILEFKHHKTELSCHLTVKNEIPVGISELIKYYLSLDSKLSKLMLLIKVWADCYDLRNKESFSSYAISLLVIFYLQQAPYKLPAVIDLQKEVPCDEIDGWNCAFGPVEYTNTKLKKATLLELLTGFFKFYGNFDYISHVVSPYYGTTIPKLNFKERTNGFCIQDLFELCDNVSSKVSLPCAGMFSNVSRHSIDLLKSNDLYKLLLSSSNTSVKFNIEVTIDVSEFKKLVLDVLTKILLCEVEEIKSEEADVCYICTGRYNVWDNRIDQMGHIPEGISTNLEKEILISSSIVKNTEEFVWKMIVTLKFEDEFSIGYFEIKVGKDASILTHIGHFLYVKMRNLLNLDALENIKVEQVEDTDEECEIIEIDDVEADISLVKQEEQASVSNEGISLIEKELSTIDIVDISEVKTEEQTGGESVPIEGISLEEEPLTVVKVEISEEETEEQTSVVNVSNEGMSLEEPSTVVKVEISEETTEEQTSVENVSNEGISLKEEPSTIDEAAERTSVESVPNEEISLNEKEPSAIDIVGISEVKTQEPMSLESVTNEGISFNEKEPPTTDKVEISEMETQEQTIVKSVPNEGISLIEKEPSTIDKVEISEMDTQEQTSVESVPNEGISLNEKEPSTIDKVEISEMKTREQTSVVRVPNEGISLNEKEPSTIDKVEISDMETQEQTSVESVPNEGISFNEKEPPTTDKVEIFEMETQEQTSLESVPNEGISLNEKEPSTIDKVEIFEMETQEETSVESVPNERISLNETEPSTTDKVEISEMETQEQMSVESVPNEAISLKEKEPLTMDIVEISEVKTQEQTSVESVPNEEISLNEKDPSTIDQVEIPEMKTQEETNVESVPNERISLNQKDPSTIDKVEISEMGTQEQTSVESVPNEGISLEKEPSTIDQDKKEVEVDKTSDKGLSIPDSNKITPIEEKLSTSNSNQILTNGSSEKPALDSKLPVPYRVMTQDFVPRFKGYILTRITVDQPFDEQLLAVHDMLQLPHCHLSNNCQIISSDLSTSLSSLYPEIEVIFFGSAATNLYIQGSSVDILITGVESDKSDIVELSRISVKIASGKKFTNSVVIGGNKMKPATIRCFHKDTRMYCDIRVRDMLSLKTSELINYYVKIDLKVRILIVFIKFWAERYTMIGKNLSTSYLFSLMVIFYLQQEPYNFPSVFTLQKDSSFLVNGWNCGFTPIDFENKLKDVDIFDVVKGFFKFYAEFDGLSYVISPYYGSPISKMDFKDPDKLPEIFRDYVEKKQQLDISTNICVQDFFVHCTNIGSIMNVSVATRFVALCKSALEIMEQKEKKMIPLNLLTNCQIKKFTEFIIDYPKGVEEEKWIEFTKKTVFSTLTSDLGCIVELDIVPTCFDTVIYYCKGYIDNENLDLSEIKEVMITPNVRRKRRRFTTVEVTNGRPPNKVSFIIRGEHGNPCSWGPLFYTKMTKLLTMEEFEKFCTSTSIIATTTERTEVVAPLKIEEPIEVVTSTDDTPMELTSTDDTPMELTSTDDTPMELTSTDDIPMELTSTPSPTTFEGVTSTSECDTDVSEEIANISERTRNILLDVKDKLYFQEQITILSKTIVRSLDNECNMIIADLKEGLCKNFHFGEILCFGSAVTGLFSETSCVDIHIQDIKPRLMNMIRKCIRNNYFIEVVYEGETLKCKHVKTKLSCIIHINDQIFGYTSQLIQYYLSYHRSLIDVVAFIKFWFKTYELEFTNYAIYLMVIFWLQQKPYYLPPVALLISTTPRFMDGWKVTFEGNKSPEVTERLSKVSLAYLIQDFFKFYRDFNYLDQVIAPYFGAAIPKTSFIEPLDLPSCYYNRGINLPLISGFCIQDPFIHNKNLTLNVTLATSGTLTALCRGALHLMSLGERDLTYKLLTGSMNKNRYCFVIEKKDEISTDEWVNNVKKTLDELLTKVLCGKIVDRKENDSKTNFCFIFYHCALQCNFWSDRHTIMKNVPPDSEYIRKESQVSWILMNDPKRADNIMVYITVRFSKNQDQITVTFTRKCHYYIIDFFYSRILEALEPFVKKTSSLNFSTIKAPYKIMVKGVKKDQVRDAHTYFEKFGALKSMSISEAEKDPTLRYIYCHVNSYFHVIQEEHEISGKKLKIIPLAPVSGPFPKVKFKDPRLGIIHSFVDSPNFETQLAILEKKLKVDKTVTEEKKKSIDHDLQSSLIQQFNTIKIHFFGLDFYGCRFRFFLENVRQDPDLESSTLRIIKNLLIKSGNFSDVRVTDTQVPLICSKHVKTQTNFDISIHNKLPVRCNDLIKYYLSLDPKLHSLMILIKFWAQCYDLTGLEGFSFYSLCLLVIFYLQHEPFKLPTVFDLQKDASPDIIDNWNCAYTEFIDFTSPTLRNSSVSELLAGFFKFYGYFNYVSYVISPYSGQQLKKIRFLKPYCLPEMYKDYVKNNKDLFLDCGICIQAPFELSRNMTRNISLESAGRFASLCRCAYSVLKTSQNQVLYKLFLYCGIKDNHEFPSFVIEKENGIDDSNWFQSVKTYSLKLLSEIFKCKFSQVASFDSSQSISYTCVGQYDIFKNRISMWKQISGDDTQDFGKETKITSLVVGDRQPEHTWNFVVVLTFATNPTRVKVTFSKKGGNVAIFHFCQFFSTRLITFLRPKRTNLGATTTKNNTSVTTSPDGELSSETKTELSKICDAKPLLNKDKEAVQSSLDKDKVVTDVKKKTQPSLDKDKIVTDVKKKTQPSLDKDKVVTGVKKKTQPSLDKDKIVTDVKKKTQPSLDKDKVITGVKKKTQPSLDKDKVVTGVNRKTKPSLDKDKVITDVKKKSRPPLYKDKVVTDVKKKIQPSLDKYKVVTDVKKRTQPSLDKDKVVTSVKKKTQPSLDKDKVVTGVKRKTQLSLDKDKVVTGVKKKTQPSLDKDKEVIEVKVEVQPILDKDKEVTEVKVEKQPSLDKDVTEATEKARSTNSSPFDNLKITEDGEIVDDDEDDDVPSDFFDDFSNEDFLEGLDIVDVWDSEPPPKETEKKPSRSRSRSSHKRRKRSKSRSRSRDRKKRKENDDKRRTTKSSRSRESSSSRYRNLNRYRCRSRSRSNSPRRKSRKVEETKRKSFLEEITEKLNEVTKPVTPPTPVIYSNLAQVQLVPNPVMPTYDASFFIGAEFSKPQVPFPVPAPVPPVQEKIPEKKQIDSKEDPQKLFNEGKISLTEFLTLSVRKDATANKSPPLLKKVKLISRCMDIVTLLTEARPPTGRWTIKSPPQRTERPKTKFQSPLRSLAVVRFSYTTPPKNTEEDAFATTLNRILQRFGLPKLQEKDDVVEDLVEMVTKAVRRNNATDKDAVVRTLKISLLGQRIEEEIKKITMGTCTDGTGYCTLGTQVGEDDLGDRGLTKSNAASGTSVHDSKSDRSNDGCGQRPSSRRRRRRRRH